MQVSLLGFMDKYGAAAFMDQLWTLLLSAQKTVGGVPAEVSAQLTTHNPTIAHGVVSSATVDATARSAPDWTGPDRC